VVAELLQALLPVLAPVFVRPPKAVMPVGFPQVVLAQALPDSSWLWAQLCPKAGVFFFLDDSIHKGTCERVLTKLLKKCNNFISIHTLHNLIMTSSIGMLSVQFSVEF
jgi:hypothetical protein